MDNGLLDGVKRELSQKKKEDYILKKFHKKGYDEFHVYKVIKNVHSSNKERKKDSVDDGLVRRRFILKEVFDKIANGFGSRQFMLILFNLIGASYFLMGIVNGLRTLFELFTSNNTRLYVKRFDIRKNSVMAWILFSSLTFLLIPLARKIDSIALFSTLFLFSGVGTAVIGEIYLKELGRKISVEKRGVILSNAPKLGLIILVIGLLLGGFFLDKFPLTSRISGDWFAFGITSIAILISGVYLLKLHDFSNKGRARDVFKNQFSILKESMKALYVEKSVLMVLAISSLISIVQSLGNTYYGVFIYKNFSDSYFGGFINVAIVFVVAIISALFCPYIARRLSKFYGTSPMMAFGTVLVSILPLTYWYNQNLAAIAMATVCGVLGGSIVSLATSLFINRKIKDVSQFYQSLSMLVALPYLVLFPIGAFVAQIGLRSLFLYLGVVPLIAVLPLSIVLVVVKKN